MLGSALEDTLLKHLWGDRKDEHCSDERTHHEFAKLALWVVAALIRQPGSFTLLPGRITTLGTAS